MRTKSYRASLDGPAPVAMPATARHDTGPELARGVAIPMRLANRHGLVTGQTGTGKSVTLLRLAETFASAGTAVFLADVKGDLGILSRTVPVRTLDAYGTGRERFAASPAAMGPDLFSRALDLTDAQAGTVELAFHLAAREGHSLDSAGDLTALLSVMLARAKELNATLGQVSPASVGVIRRAMLRLDPAVISGPSFDVAELIVPGRVTMLRAERLMRSPRLYAALLMFMLDQLEQRLPEVGDQPVPRLAFFFDEAHLLFRDVPPALLSRIERTVRLIRSKGVGVYFASQAPGDIPEAIRDQLAHRVTHSRAYGVGRACIETMHADGSPRLHSGPPVAINPPACLTAPPIPEPAQGRQPVEPATVAPIAPRDLVPRPVPHDDAFGPLSLVAGLGVIVLALVGALALVGVSPVWVLATCAGLALPFAFKLPKRGRRH